MRKIYSLVLMATALLIGTNAWATVRTAGTADELKDAWEKAQTGDEIQLTASFSISKTLWLGTATMADNAPLSITLNLNGDTLSSTAQKIFVLSHGSLNVIGNGGIKHDIADATAYLPAKEEYNSAYEIFRVLGSTYKGADYDAKTSDTHYTHLSIGENVKLVAAVNGIVVDYCKAAPATKDNAWAAGGKEFPTWTNLYTNVYSSNKVDGKKDRGVANGVRIDVSGKIQAIKYAIKANGNLGATSNYAHSNYAGYYQAPGVQYSVEAGDEQYSPYIVIGKTAELLTLKPERTDAVAAYGGGYARWFIEGAVVEGSTAVYVKSGEVDIKDAKITSNFTGTPGVITERSSGVDAGGSGIVVESSGNYAGGTEVTVQGNTVITPTSGYALEETITNAADTSKVESVTIQGGTFKEGESGTIVVTTQTTGTSVTIDGGTFEFANETGGGVDLGGKSLEQFLTDQAVTSETTHTVVVETDDQGHQTIVISNGDKPTVANSVIGAAENASINWENTGVTTETLTTDKKLAELQISQNYNQTLIIPEGKTLEVGRVVLGAKAQIVVKPGAKFIVSGAQGLAAFKESNLVLENANGKRAIFLFNPNVTSNTHPMATFEIVSTSWRVSSAESQAEVIGIPTHNAITSIGCKEAGKYGYLQRYTQNGTWENIAFTDANPFPYEKLSTPFAPYALTAYRAQNEDPLTFVFGGELVGNSNADLNANLKWSFFANSYSAELDLATFLAGLKANAQNVADAVYVSSIMPNGHWRWDALDEEEIKDPENPTVLQPLQGFLLLNEGSQAETNVINYETMVYAPAVPGYIPATPAPRRLVAINNTAKVKVVVTNAEGVKDGVSLRETENVKAIEKYMNDDVNIYATTDKKNAIFAAEDLENTYVGFSTIEGGKFTISFANVEGREFVLVDHETGAQVAMVEGATYEFTAAANSVNDYRFEIVSAAKMPTAIENAEAVKSAKGIYTITGQYVGEMNVWNTLPAGIYVVNGEKLVK